MQRAWAGGWMATALFALPFVACAQSAATVNAVWVEREVSFSYMPLTSFYSCDGLRDKVRWIVGELGARPGFEVRTRGCVERHGPEQFPGVVIIAAFPAEATPERLEQLARESAQRQLAARAAGQAAPVVEAATQFPARVRRVQFRSDRSTLDDLQDGDCELMEQLVRTDVFGQFGARVVDAQIRCVPRQVSLAAVRMTVEVLEPVPAQ